MAATVQGRVWWAGKRDSEGHREFTLRSKVSISNLATDGPYTVMNAAGLPAIGAVWNFEGVTDSWAQCYPDMDVQPQRPSKPDDPIQVFLVTQKFSTKPLTRCQTTSIENPLNEPTKIGGSFTRKTIEAELDKDGKKITNSAHEQIKGPAVEFDEDEPTVWCEMNVAVHPLSTFAPMINTVNDATLWGLDARCVKLANAPWRRKLYGTCTYYYTVRYEFEINEDGFDREVLDEGTKVLKTGGSSGVPGDFQTYVDPVSRQPQRIILKNGAKWDGTGDPGKITIKRYKESNFLSLGIPTSL